MRSVRTIVVACLWMLCAAASAADVVNNAAELGTLLDANRKPVTLEAIALQRGCGPAGCQVALDAVTVLQDKGGLRTADGRVIKLISHAPGDSKVLPTINWDPLQAFNVVRAGKRWGTCIEFAHAGVGNSGSFQRWRTVMLVPRGDGRSGAVAHRFVGYWAGCGLLSEADGADEVMLPLIEPVAVRKAELHLAWQKCGVVRCRSVPDERGVKRNTESASGALIVGGS